MNIKNDLEKLKEAHDAFGKVLNGAKWQARNNSHEQWGDDHNSWAVEQFIEWHVCGLVRLKPEPKTRLVRVEELPFPCVVNMGAGSIHKVVTVYCEQSLFIDGSWLTTAALSTLGAIWSADRKTWKPFTVEVKE